MKVPRDGGESKTEARKANQRTNHCGDVKIPKDNREEGDASGCGIEPSATALIPPWLRNSLGLSEKGDKKPNQKCLKVHSATNEQPLCMESGDTKVDFDGDCLKCHFYIQDTPSTNPILEVNIGSEADFVQDAGAAEKLSSPWRPKLSRLNQYGAALYATSKDREVSRSEMTSINVVVPTEDIDEEKRKFRPQKVKSKFRRSSNACFKSEDNLKLDPENVCKQAQTKDFLDEFPVDETISSDKYLDARLLLLCGKKTIDSLTQDDVALLQEMKNQIGHKEGFEKLFNDIRESTFIKKLERKEEYRREAMKDCDIPSNNEENRSKSKVVDEERKSPDDGRKHHEKKIRNQLRQVKCIDEPEADKEKKYDKWKYQRSKDVHPDKEKKTKLRHCDYSVIEKAVTETLQKFIELYRVQVPQDVVNSMKKNIIQTLQSEYHETNGSRRGLDAVLAVQDHLKNVGGVKCSVHHLLMEEREEKYKAGIKRASTNFTSEENVISKDVPTEVDKTRGFEEKDNGKKETLNVLRKDFERCLELMQHQLDLTGTRLCTVILEKTGMEDKKLRIVQNFSNGATESLKIYDRPNKGSPEGDNLITAACNSQQNFQKENIKLNQWSQTGEKTYGKVGTQTDWVDLSVKHLMNADLNPGLYRITKATESGRFYLTPEVLDDDEEEEEEEEEKIPTTVKRVSSEMCMLPEGEQLKSELGKCISRETFISERGNFVRDVKTLWRVFRSDCLGLNNVGELYMSKLMKPMIGNLTGSVKAMKEQKEEEIAGIEAEEEMEAEERQGGKRDFTKKESAVDTSDPEGYHRECVWLWNGKKMSPGIDLKVHVEDLLREKLSEILYEGRVTERKSNAGESANSKTTAAEKEISAKNLEIRKTRAKFCITNEESISRVASPFVFSASRSDIAKPPEDLSDTKSVREVGTQNSQQSILSLNHCKLKPKSKLCTVTKLSKRKQINRLQHSMSKTLESPHPYAESVGEAKKVKLEFRPATQLPANVKKGSNTDSVRECFSLISNASTSSNDAPVRVKLIGIEVSKEKSPGDGDSGKSSGAKSVTAEEFRTKSDQRKYKHWEIIEKVLNRVSQKEKDILWDDIRDFVKKKIGRDINDEGAREVCIEIEQDVPKFAKGKASHVVVARGNYTRNEGDVAVEVDLTLDDLERILRHRQKKMRRRRHSQSKSKVTSTSSDTDYHTFKYRPFVGGDYLTNKELRGYN